MPPALELIAAYGRHRFTLLYVDPPYLGTTRDRNHRHEMTGEAAHRELAEALHACRATVVLSGYAWRPVRHRAVRLLAPPHPQRRHQPRRAVGRPHRSPVVQQAAARGRPALRRV
ncbi:MAG TPA: hypothetical protein VLH10_04035 [Yinghuangia sp.]|nr:hypothetical protein [Yinghuangia sp.]